MELNRGDIVIVNLYPKKGNEVGKIRPAVIISGDDENSILDTVSKIRIKEKIAKLTDDEYILVIEKLSLKKLCKKLEVKEFIDL